MIEGVHLHYHIVYLERKMDGFSLQFSYSLTPVWSHVCRKYSDNDVKLMPLLYLAKKLHKLLSAI